MLRVLTILAIGAGLGALMGYFGKCSSGACPLTANPWRGAGWGLCLALIVVWPTLVNTFRKPVPTSPNVIHVEDETEFRSVVSKGVCLVDFYADWCGPCRSLAPTINKLADEFQGKVKVLKINVDKFSKLAGEYRANSIPTVLILKDGKEMERVVGARSAAVYETALNSLKDD